MMTRFFLSIVLVLFCSSCVKPPVTWRYDPGLKSSEIPDKTALILPVIDSRVASNDDPSLLRFVPFVIYETENDFYFDQILMQNGTTFNATQDLEVGFKLREDIHQAAKKQFAYSGEYGPVFGDQYEVGQWRADDKPHHQLQITVQELSYQRKHLRYGFGPFAFIPHAFGAPTYSLTLGRNILLEISHESSDEKHSRMITDSNTFHNGWYRNLSAEQRALDNLGIELRKNLEQIIQDSKTRY